MAGFTVEKLFPSCLVQGGVVFLYPSRLLDSYTPSVLRANAPSMEYDDSIFSATIEKGVSKPVRRLFRLLNLISSRTTELSESEVLFDATDDCNKNIAHLIQHQLASLLVFQSLACSNLTDFRIIVKLRFDSPKFAHELFRLFGFSTMLESHRTTVGNIIVVKDKYYHTPMYSDFLRKAVCNSNVTKGIATPRNIFINRRGRRALTNNEEVQKLLSSKGFKEVFFEDYSLQEQIAMARNANNVIALHGAALAFLSFRDVDEKGFLIEIFPGGFATNWGRQICKYSNLEWVGVQGKISPKDTEVVYGKRHCHTREGELFAVSITSLELAIEEAERLIASK